MDIRTYLREKGISYKEARRPAGAQAMMPCPSCGDKNFSINLDTGAYSCYKKNKCGITGGTYKFQKLFGDEPKRIETESTKNKVYGRPQQKLEDPDESIKKFFSSRKLDFEKAREHFKVMKLGEWVAFRYFDYGEHIGTKFRKISEKKFYNEKDCKPGLYNIDNCRDKDTLIITEGELDCIALYQMTGLDAVSVSNGTGDTRWIEDSWDDLEAYKNIILIFDTDHAGQDCAIKTAKRLGIYRTSNVVLPHNDINDCLINGMEPDEMCSLIFGTKTVGQPKVQVARTYSDDIIEDLANPDRLRGIQLPRFKHSMNIIKGIRKPENTVITGQNHAGKSTVINQFIIDLITQDEVCAIASLEMKPKRYLRWLLMQTLRPEEMFNEKFVKKRLDEIGERLYIVDIQGRVHQDELFEHFALACRKHGATQLFVDSLMKIQMPNKNELKEQADFCDEYINLGDEFSAHTWLVAHPRKGKEDEDRPGKVDVAGAAHITNAADNVLTVWRVDEKTAADLKHSKGYAPKSVLSFKKVREHGTMGDVFLGFNNETKKIYELDYQPESRI